MHLFFLSGSIRRRVQMTRQNWRPVQLQRSSRFHRRRWGVTVRHRSPHSYSPRALLPHSHCPKHQLILLKELCVVAAVLFFLKLIAVNRVEINRLIICHYRKQCHIRDHVFPSWPAAQFASAEVTWGCGGVFHGWRGIARQKDDSCFPSSYMSLFVCTSFSFFCQEFVEKKPRLEKTEDTFFRGGSIWARPSETHIRGCLFKIKAENKLIPSLFFFCVDMDTWCL